MRALEEQVAAAEGKLREREAGFRAAEEETSRSIRFLEKENLELMMEIKALKEQIIRLTAEADALRAAVGAGTGTGTGKAPLALLAHAGGSNSGVVAGMPVPPPAEPVKTVAASAAVPASGAMAVADKENGPGGVVVGESLLRARSDDETAPPFRSLNEDDTVNANSQCKQS